MRRIVLTAILAATVGLSGCDMPDYVKANFNKSTLPTNAAAGSFKGQVKVLFVEPKKPDDRDVQLLEPFGYRDSKGRDWDVPIGYVSDGASIPWGLWTFIGGPYDGPYREAAIIHDYFCDKKDRTWEEVHLMFLEAALKRGVPESTAQTMYAGILYGGPRWPTPSPLKKAQITPTPGAGTTKVDPGITKRPVTQSEKQQFEDIKAWIEREKPTPEQIMKRMEELRKAKGLPTK